MPLSLLFKPAQLYNIMPFFYLGSGFSIPFTLDNVFAFCQA
jgi:hypothetical protein